MTYSVTRWIKAQSFKEGLMSQRQQLRLVFSQSIPVSSQPLKMSLSSSPRRSRKPRDSAFVVKMRELEKLSPEYADVLAGIADGIIAQMLGAPLE